MSLFDSMRITDLPNNVVAVEALVLIKGLDEDGDVCFFTRTSEGLTTWEALGMLEAAAEIRRAGLVDAFKAE